MKSWNVLWQYFSDITCYEHKVPCDPTQIGRFRRDIGEDGMESLLKITIDPAVFINAVKPAELERVIVDTTVPGERPSHTPWTTAYWRLHAIRWWLWPSA